MDLYPVIFSVRRGARRKPKTISSAKYNTVNTDNTVNTYGAPQNAGLRIHGAKETKNFARLRICTAVQNSQM